MPFLGPPRCILEGLRRHPADFGGQTEGVLVSRLERLLPRCPAANRVLSVPAG
ncbi:MAG TPA: hypothetical protein VMV76_01365 [Dehalococcoidia bacterium]|nr:hypothetical protein [Dehalococcoidia bacterium]